MEDFCFENGYYNDTFGPFNQHSKYCKTLGSVTQVDWPAMLLVISWGKVLVH